MELASETTMGSHNSACSSFLLVFRRSVRARGSTTGPGTRSRCRIVISAAPLLLSRGPRMRVLPPLPCCAGTGSAVISSAVDKGAVLTKASVGSGSEEGSGWGAAAESAGNSSGRSEVARVRASSPPNRGSEVHNTTHL